MSSSRNNRKRNARGEFAAQVRLPRTPKPAPFSASGTSVTPVPASQLARELQRSTNSAGNADSFVNPELTVHQYARDAGRLESVLARTWNPLKLWRRRIERRYLESDYGPIDWRA
jgi:hypothetical protein